MVIESVVARKAEGTETRSDMAWKATSLPKQNNTNSERQKSTHDPSNDFAGKLHSDSLHLLPDLPYGVWPTALTAILLLQLEQQSAFFLMIALKR